MIEDLKPYPQYKDSGLPWLGEVPRHWEIRRGKSLFSDSNLPVRDGDEIVTCFRDGQVTLRKNRRTSGFMTALYETGYQGVRTGQLVIHAMDAFAGAIGISDSDGKCTPEYIVLDPLSNSAHPSYYSQLLRHAARQQFILVQCPAVRERAPRFRYPNFGCMWMPLPSASEQAAIARFLAWATNRLDRAIGAKRRIIVLLQEQKQAIIHRAVTRGLDPSVPLKDSGIPWLGEIPEHWRVTSLRMHYSVELGKMLDEKRFTGHNPIPYLRNRDVQWDRVLVEELPKMDIAPQELDRYTLKLGDMLVCEGGQVGRSAFWLNHLPVCGYQKALHRVRALNTEENCPRYLFYQMRLAAGLGVFEAESNESTISHLTCEKLRSSRFTFPPLEEQIKISRTLDERLKEEENTVSRLVHEISLLREYRTRLIADVVTGKLDVREVEAGLPEEELQDQPDVAAGYDADGAEDDAESDLIDTVED